jgi:hypothetical protein
MAGMMVQLLGGGAGAQRAGAAVRAAGGRLLRVHIRRCQRALLRRRRRQLRRPSFGSDAGRCDHPRSRSLRRRHRERPLLQRNLLVRASAGSSSSSSSSRGCLSLASGGDRVRYPRPSSSSGGPAGESRRVLAAVEGMPPAVPAVCLSNAAKPATVAPPGSAHKGAACLWCYVHIRIQRRGPAARPCLFIPVCLSVCLSRAGTACVTAAAAAGWRSSPWTHHSRHGHAKELDSSP